MIIGLRIELAAVELHRHGRGRCVACDRRRILFSLAVLGPGGDVTSESDRKCAECAGIVAGEARDGFDELVAAPTFHTEVRDGVSHPVLDEAP